MFILDEELTAIKMGKILNDFNTKERLKLAKRFEYYKAKQAILQKEEISNKPCNKIVKNY